MNHYETIFIVDPDTADDERELIMNKVNSAFSQKDGTLLLLDNWGVRRLAYEIKKKKQGRFIRLDYCGNGNLVDELERNFRLDHRVLKFMTIQIDKDVDVEALKVAITPEEPEAGAAEAAEETVSADQPTTPEASADTETETAAGDIAQPASDTEEQS
ncbi:MAG: 30S ribosomal protein S6 [Desulfobacteraceae bacterium]|jgi:small subunit ribosomal protein S6|nr:MAG: 30S ribosomal protein S6 [Desulfobacteraceae bacterium]